MEILGLSAALPLNNTVMILQMKLALVHQLCPFCDDHPHPHPHPHRTFSLSSLFVLLSLVLSVSCVYTTTERQGQRARARVRQAMVAEERGQVTGDGSRHSSSAV